MRFRELVSEKLVHAMPLSARAGQGTVKKADPLIPAPPLTPDPVMAIAQAVPQLAQAVAGGSQMAAQQAVALDDAEEQAAAQAVEMQAKRTK
jgi:hypothetical protein